MNDFIDKRNKNEGENDVRRHAKAPSAGSTKRQAAGLGRSFRGAFATQGDFGDVDGSGAPSPRWLLAVLLPAAALALLVLASSASAGRVAGFGVLGTGADGVGAGQLGTIPTGVAVNTTGAGGVAAGDVYVADSRNNRIAEYSGSGTFIRAFGLNVVTSGPDNVTPASAVQSVEVPAAVSGGTFSLGFNGATTGGTATGTLTEGSSTVTDLVTASGSGDLVSGSFTVSGLSTSSGQFAVGQPIAGEGIPSGTTVVNLNGSILTLSQAATEEGTGIALASSGPLPFTAGEEISGDGIPAGTTVTAAGSGSLTLSAPVEAGASGQGVSLSAELPYDATAATVQSALTALGTIGSGNATVSGGPGGAAPFAVTFGGALEETPVPLITADSSALSGGSVTVSNTTSGVSAYEVCDVAAHPTDVCAKGTAGASAGAIAGEQGLAVDPATGNVFAASNTNKRIDVFSAKGQFEGAFGWKVNASAPADELQFCSFATGCRAGTKGVGAGQFGTLTGVGGQGATPAVSPVDGHVFVPDPDNRRVDEFSIALDGSGVAVGASFVKAFGGDVAPAIDEQQRVTVSGATGGTFSLSLDGNSTDVAGSGDVEAGSREIEHISTSSGAFSRGEEVFGPGIPAGTRITVVTFDSLTLTAAATATTSGAALHAALPYDAEAFAIRSAVEAIPGVGATNATASGAPGGPWTIEFIGKVEGTDIDQLSGDGSGLTGSSPTVAVKTLRNGANGEDSGSFQRGRPAAVLETCTIATTCKAGGEQGSAEDGVFARRAPDSVAVDSTGAIYVTGQSQGSFVVGGLASTDCNGACGVLKFNAEGKEPQVFAPEQLSSPREAKPASAAARWVAVDPSNDRVEVVKKVSETTFKLFEFSRAGAFIDASPPGLEGAPISANGAFAGPQGFAIGTQGRSYLALQGSSAAGVPVQILSNPPAPRAHIEPAGEITQTSATLAGLAEPSEPGVEGGFPTFAYFEYSTDGVSWTSTEPIELGTGSGSGDPGSCPAGNPPACDVSQTVTGLASGQPYLARLVVTNGTAATSSTANFVTGSAAPAVSRMGAGSVGEDSATIFGTINPNNRSTSYHFEWGADTSYGNRIPADFDQVAGSGGKPVKVTASLSGLQPNSIYHFRIVAESEGGRTEGPDTVLQTLNTSDLPDNRRPELVSPVDKKPAGAVRLFLATQLTYQAAEDGEGAAYPILNGVEGSTAGGQVVFAAQRGSDSWSSRQLTPPALLPPRQHEAAQSGSVRYADRQDLKCTVVESRDPLTPDVPGIDVDNGVTNLYRWTAADDSYTLITSRPPLNPTFSPIGVYFEVAGATADCGKIFFRAKVELSAEGYQYFSNPSYLYEWDEGTLRDAGLRPDGTVSATDGSVGEQVGTNEWSVSRSGRLFFGAVSDEGKDSGKAAVFVRNSPTDVVDASQPTTSTPPLGARYETASPDGGHVLFLANYGLTPVSSDGPAANCTSVESLKNVPCDLYDYDVATGELTDISADSNPADTNGSVTQGVMDISKDGSTVYFLARGQLVPGEGPTYRQNLQGGGTASLYRWHEGDLRFVGTLTAGDVEENSSGNNQGALMRTARNWVDQTSDNGEYALFVSHSDLTGENPTGLRAAYLYTAASDSLACVSCPGGGKVPRTYPTEQSGGVQMIARQVGEGEGFDNYHPRSLGNDGRAFFNSFEALAPGAVAGQPNVYEWYRGQVSLLATGADVKFQDLGGPDGRDAFLTTSGKLAPEDTDFASDLYDLRSGGGFPAPPTPPASCDPQAGECQGPVTPPPAAPTPDSTGFVGPGNPPVAKPKHHKKKHHKKHKKHRKHHHKQGRHGKKHRQAKRGAGSNHRKSQRNAALKSNRGGAK